MIGQTGSGKSSILQAIVLGGSYFYSPEEIEFYLIDMKEGAAFYSKDFDYSRLKHVRMIAANCSVKDLRSFMFERVYRNPVAKGEESRAKDMLCRLFEHYVAHPEDLPEDFQPQMSFDGLERTVCDYIAGMTDKYAVDKYTEIFIPTGWHVRG
jgi:dGTP triphosphohydrolase